MDNKSYYLKLFGETLNDYPAYAVSANIIQTAKYPSAYIHTLA